MGRSKKKDKASEQQESSEDSKDRAEWDTTAEGILIEGLKSAVSKGQRSDINFKASVYQELATSLQAAGYTFNSKQVKSRWTRFKTAQKTVHMLLHVLSGFGWDDDTKCVTAEEKVWIAILFDKAGEKTKKYNEYNYWRSHSFPLYQEVTDLIGGSRATGNFAFTSVSDDLPHMDNEEEEKDGQEDNVDKTLDAIDKAPTPSSSSSSSAPENAASLLSHATPETPAIGRKRAATPIGTPVSAKRAKPTSSAQIGTLCNSVDRLVTGLLASPKKGRSNLKNEAFNTVKVEEGLSPHSLARARRVFRGSDELAEEYLSFDGSDEAESRARTYWLLTEMDSLDNH